MFTMCFCVHPNAVKKINLKKADFSTKASPTYCTSVKVRPDMNSSRTVYVPSLPIKKQFNARVSGTVDFISIGD